MNVPKVSYFSLAAALLLGSAFAASGQENRAAAKNIIRDAEQWRDDLAGHGVIFTGQSTSDVFANTTGGASTGSTYNGMLLGAVSLDLEKAVGWKGASFDSTWLWVYGQNITTQHVGNSMYVDGLGPSVPFRCYQLWLQQKLLDDKVSLRAGVLGLDSEFGVSETAGFFVNATFGMPFLMVNNFPGGGPTYPMAAPAVRLAVQPCSWLTFRTAISQANPFSPEVNQRNLAFNFGSSGGLLSLNEVAASWNNGSEYTGLAGTAKAGFWVQSGPASSDAGGAPFAYTSPSSPAYGTGFYAMIDQQLTSPCRTMEPKELQRWAPYVRGAGERKPTLCREGLRSFARVGFSPQTYSVMSLYLDAGLVYKGLLPGRKKDQIGAGFVYAQMGPGMDAQASNQGLPGPSYEAIAEFSYSLVLAPNIALQPDLQYVIHPNGTTQYGNALVIGLRAVVSF